MLIGRVLGASTRADFEHCDVALFLGKNPWHSHSIPRARVTTLRGSLATCSSVRSGYISMTS